MTLGAGPAQSPRRRAGAMAGANSSCSPSSANHRSLSKRCTTSRCRDAALVQRIRDPSSTGDALSPDSVDHREQVGGSGCGLLPSNGSPSLTSEFARRKCASRARRSSLAMISVAFRTWHSARARASCGRSSRLPPSTSTNSARWLAPSAVQDLAGACSRSVRCALRARLNLRRGRNTSWRQRARCDSAVLQCIHGQHPGGDCFGHPSAPGRIEVPPAN